MLAYNKKALDDLAINEAADKACRKGLISKAEYLAVCEAHPDKLYAPNIFIQIGLFLVTALIVSMSFGLFALMVNGIFSAMNYGILSIFISLVMYAMLELFIRARAHYHSGIDDALLWMSGILLFSGINMLFPQGKHITLWIIVFVISGFATMRFAKADMSVVCFLSFLAILFYALIPFGIIAKMAMPFVLMAASLVVYIVIKKMKGRNDFRHYSTCLLVLETLSLAMIYASVNYFVVREASNEFFNLHLRRGETISGGWLFWIAIVVIPIIYVVRSLQKKDSVLLRMGLLTIAATLFTVRYYYPIMATELLLTLGGMALIIIVWAITKYFKVPKHGISIHQTEEKDLEGLVVAETFGDTATAVPGFQFGGGSGGGGGATGQF